VEKMGLDGYCIDDNNESLDARRENAADIFVFYLFGFINESGIAIDVPSGRFFRLRR
jgi:hypothetical protein